MDIFLPQFGFANQSANIVYAGPASGSAAAPAFRALVALDFPTGALIGRAYVEYLTNADLTTALPSDDTTPLITEGAEILSVAITPKRTTSIIRARFMGWCGTTLVENVGAALFRGSTCLNVVGVQTTAAGQTSMVLEYEDSPASVSAQTYSVRVGTGSGNAVRMNGRASGRFYGGASRATLVLEEIAA